MAQALPHFTIIIAHMTFELKLKLNLHKFKGHSLKGERLSREIATIILMTLLSSMYSNIPP